MHLRFDSATGHQCLLSPLSRYPFAGVGLDDCLAPLPSQRDDLLPFRKVK
jgi:hypothetical protein